MDHANFSICHGRPSNLFSPFSVSRRTPLSFVLWAANSPLVCWPGWPWPPTGRLHTVRLLRIPERNCFNRVCLASMGVWQGVAKDSLKYSPGLPCPTLLHPVSEPPLKRPYGHLRVVHPQGRRPAAVFYPFGHPTPYAYVAREHEHLVICLSLGSQTVES
jgi:hypothetical protein